MSSSGLAQGALCCVTGATGFIGTRLCKRLLVSDFQVRALIRVPRPGPWHESVGFDLESDRPATPALRGVDTIFHLAGKVHDASGALEGPDSYRRLNVEGTRRLLEGAAQAGVKRFVLFSTVKAIGEAHRGCWDESVEARPITAYGKSNLEAERMVLQGGHVAHACVLRLSLVYGPSTKGNLPRMIGAIQRRRFPPLANVRNRRSMVHVDDVVQAALLAAGRPEASGQTYIVTDGHIYSTGEIYSAIRRALGMPPAHWSTPVSLLRMAGWSGDLLERLFGRRMPIDSDVLSKLTGSECYSAGKIQRELGFRPHHTLAEALPEMVGALNPEGCPGETGEEGA